jgi:hypothetical protein
MKVRTSIVAVLIAALPLVIAHCVASPLVATAADAVGEGKEVEAGFVSLFDGKTFAGWEGNEAMFRIDQGGIVGRNLKTPIPHNYFLCTQDTYGDFELRLDVKVVGKDANAGIQFRSARITDSEEVSGYQADVGGVGNRLVWGSLYDESRRNRFMAEADPAVVKSAVKPDDWNAYVIRAVGPKVELFINGVQTLDYTESDDTIPRTGIIGLQIHSGPPTEAWYRDVRIKSL